MFSYQDKKLRLELVLRLMDIKEDSLSERVCHQASTLWDWIKNDQDPIVEKVED